MGFLLELENILQPKRSDDHFRWMGCCTAVLPLQLLLLLTPHYAFRPLVQLVFRERHGQLEQELFVDWFEVVERHPIGIDYGVEYVIERVKILLQAEFVEKLAEAQRRPAATSESSAIHRLACQISSRASRLVTAMPGGVEEASRTWNGHFR